MENQNKQESYSFKTHLVIPANFVITLAVAICFVAVKNFTDDLSPIVIWFYFAISVLATFVAIFDLKVNKEKNKTVVKLTIHEGRNHQVKKMFEAINKKVIKLHRDEFAGISSRGLYEGQHRKLTFEEVKNLKKLAYKK